MESAGCWTKPT